MTYEETKLSVIIVNYNVKYFLEQCLYSVRAAVTGMDAEVFVVDNNSTDGSVEYLRPKFPEVVFIENKDNPGFAKANNQAIRQCTGEYVLLYIQKNYMDPDLSLNSICSYLNISTSYFSTIFKDETGETFTEVLIRTRMEKAKELLENTTLKNYEIAEKVGFSDPHYFGISFKKMTGCTPTEYAREKRR